MNEAGTPTQDRVAQLTPVAPAGEHPLAMASGASRDRRPIWFILVGAVVGVALGILVSVTTDVPFAPEVGLLLGALAGWLWVAGLRR